MNTEMMSTSKAIMFYDCLNKIYDFIGYDWDMYRKIENDMLNGRIQDEDYFQSWNRKMKYVYGMICKYPYGTSHTVENIQRIMAEYNKRKQNIIFDAKIANSVYVGEEQDKAIDDIVLILRELDFLQRYDCYSKDDIKKQIEQFNGVVKINGAIDLYIQFKDGKVYNKWY